MSNRQKKKSISAIKAKRNNFIVAVKSGSFVFHWYEQPSVGNVVFSELVINVLRSFSTGDRSDALSSSVMSWRLTSVYSFGEIRSRVENVISFWKPAPRISTRPGS